MPVKSNFAAGDVLTASNVNTYLTNGGLVYVTQTLVSSGSATSVSFNNCFTSTYDNYRIVIDSFQPSVAARGLNLRLRVGGVDTATNYVYAFRGLYVDGTSADNFSNAATFYDTAVYNSTTTIAIGSAAIDVFNPARTERTFFSNNSSLYNAQFGARFGIGEQNDSTAFDGFTLLLSGTGNITTLRCRVYGYRQA